MLSPSGVSTWLADCGVENIIGGAKGKKSREAVIGLQDAPPPPLRHTRVVHVNEEVYHSSLLSNRACHMLQRVWVFFTYMVAVSYEHAIACSVMSFSVFHQVIYVLHFVC